MPGSPTERMRYGLRWFERVGSVVAFTWRHPANRGHRIRSTLSAIRFQTMGRVFGQRESAAVGSHSVIEADARVYHSARAKYANPVDWNEMHAWKRALGPGSLFVDVGANVGLYTILSIEAGAEVIAVEPSRIARERLVWNLELNGYSAELVPAALGETEGTLRLTSELDNQNHLLLSADGEGVESEEVPVLTLDGLVGDRIVDGLKVDVEGAELLVLRGARRLLAERRIKLIQLEWNESSLSLLKQDRAPIAELLSSNGYELFRPDERGHLVPLSEVGYGADVFAKASSPGSNDP
jgi:FkbM family methyltransferase